MKATLLSGEAALRAFAVVLDDGDEAFAALTRLAGDHGVSAGERWTHSVWWDSSVVRA